MRQNENGSVEISRRTFLCGAGGLAFVAATFGVGVGVKLSRPPIVRSSLKASSYCSGRGTNEDLAFSAFFAELEQQGVDGVIDLPVRLASPKTLTGYMASLKATDDGRIIFSGGTDGLVVDNSHVRNGYLSPFGLQRLAIYTETDGLGVGFQYKASLAAAEHLIPSVEIDDIRIAGVDPSKGWQKGAIFEQIMQSRISGAEVRGRATLGPGCMRSAFEFINGCNLVDIYNFKADWGETGVLVPDLGRFSEGIRLYGGFVRAMKTGFLTQTAGQSHVSKGVHFDTTRIGVQYGEGGTDGSDFSSVEDCFFLRSGAEGFDARYAAIAFNSNYGTASNNRIFLNAESDARGKSRQEASYGVVVGSDVEITKPGKTAITSNSIAGPCWPIHLRAKSRLCNVKGNSIDAFGNTRMVRGGILNDGGGQNDISGNLVEDAYGKISYT